MVKKRGIQTKPMSNRIFLPLWVLANLLTWIASLIITIKDSITLMNFTALTAYAAMVFMPFRILRAAIFGLVLNLYLLRLTRHNMIKTFIISSLVVSILGLIWWEYYAYYFHYDPTAEAVRKGNYGICDRIIHRLNDRDDCYMRVAIARQDLDGCNKAILSYRRTACLGYIAKYTGNYSICDTLKVANARRRCYRPTGYD